MADRHLNSTGVFVRLPAADWDAVKAAARWGQTGQALLERLLADLLERTGPVRGKLCWQDSTSPSLKRVVAHVGSSPKVS